MRIGIILPTLGLMTAFVGVNAQAGGLTPDGTIIGVFGGVVTEGIVTHDPTLTQNQFLDNSGSAVYAIVNSTDPTLTGPGGVQTAGSALAWGANPPGGAGTFSQLTFNGGEVPTDIHQSFNAGTITFLNGTSSLDTLIFGATISFYDNVVSPADYLGTDSIIITTTSNLDQSLAQDADYINICGNGSNICGSSIEAFEDTEGGTGLTVDLTASIVGDPKLAISGVAVAPGQDPATTGVIGDEPGIGEAVPEPATWAVMLAGFGGLGAALRARRKAALATA